MSERPASRLPASRSCNDDPPAGEPVGWASIAGEARRQAAGLAGTGPVVNLCEDRLAFLVLLLAAALADRETILPSDRSPGGLRGSARCTGCDRLVRQRGHGPKRGRRRFARRVFSTRLCEADSWDDLDLATYRGCRDRHVHVRFDRQAGTLCANAVFFPAGANANAECMMEGLGAGVGIVATVPPYHMFGFELSIMVPLFTGRYGLFGTTFLSARHRRRAERNRGAAHTGFHAGPSARPERKRDRNAAGRAGYFRPRRRCRRPSPAISRTCLAPTCGKSSARRRPGRSAGETRRAKNHFICCTAWN